jgi:hypothetical protein
MARNRKESRHVMQDAYKGDASKRPRLPLAGDGDGIGDFSYRISPWALFVDVVDVVTPFCEYWGGVDGVVVEYPHGVTRSMDLDPCDEQ